MKKGKFDSYDYKVNAIMFLQHFINLFLMPLGYAAQFGSNYSRNIFSKRFKMVALQQLEKAFEEAGKCGKD